MDSRTCEVNPLSGNDDEMQNFHNSENSPVAVRLLDMVTTPGQAKTIDLEREKLSVSDIVVCTNQDTFYGAAVMINKEFLATLFAAYGTNLIILPSSINECICLSTALNIPKRALKAMVNEVNTTELDARDYLSDEVYIYRRRENEVFVMGDSVQTSMVHSGLALGDDSIY